MKIFQTDANGWSEKINFIDKNNVLVGFDNRQQCCEDFGWKIKTTLPLTFPSAADDSNEFKGDLEPYIFDTKFFSNANLNPRDEDSGYYYKDATETAIFRLYKKDDPENEPIYLILYNAHNGYYSHGFKMKIGGIPFDSENWWDDSFGGAMIMEGSL